MIWPWRRPVVSQTALFQQWMRDAAKDCATGGEIKPARVRYAVASEKLKRTVSRLKLFRVK